jgi:hypothetical protein
MRQRRKRTEPAAQKRGGESTVPPRRRESDRGSRTERALEQGLEESMAGSDTPSVLQPAKKPGDRRE